MPRNEGVVSFTSKLAVSQICWHEDADGFCVHPSVRHAVTWVAMLAKLGADFSSSPSDISRTMSDWFHNAVLSREREIFANCIQVE